MANILSDAKKQQVIALGQLGWTLRRIEAATGVRRETAGAYLKAAGIATAPGEEGQVDYGDGPMVRHSVTGKYRRTRLFLFTLGYSRKSVRLLTVASSTRRWCELHEETFRRLGGAVKVTVLDNLREGVLTPDIYDPTLNPL